MVYDKYRWKDGYVSVGKVKAQDVGERLHDLEQENGGLTPSLIVDEARSRKSILHPMFEWEDAKAAENWRQDQAQHIVRHIVTIAKGDMPEVRTWVSIVAPDDSVLDRNRIYISSKVAMADKQTRKQILQEAWSGILAWKERYKGYKELNALCDAINRAKKDKSGKAA